MAFIILAMMAVTKGHHSVQIGRPILAMEKLSYVTNVSSYVRHYDDNAIGGVAAAYVGYYGLRRATARPQSHPHPIVLTVLALAAG